MSMPTSSAGGSGVLRGGPPVTIAQNDAFTTVRNRTQPNATDANQVFTNNVASVIGSGAQFQPITSVSLDTREGYARSTTGLPYAVSGTATVVSQVVGEWMASYEDPIKAILPTSVHKESKIIIKRKYVVGGSATIVPERAPARTVALKEDVREVELTRYGADIEMNLNLFLTPDIAKEELAMKLDAQKRELSRKLTELSYQMIMREGTDITQAILRSTPGKGGSAPDMNAAHRIYSQSIFGALNKNPYGVATLLSAARYASAYSCGSARGSVMIIPHGVPDILRYARREPMTYSISGGKHTEMPKIDMEMQNAYVDNASGVKILVHYPMPHYSRGTIAPEIKMNGGLTREVWVVTKHVCMHGDQIPDLLNGGFFRVSPDLKTNTEAELAKLISDALASFAGNVGVTATKEADAAKFLSKPRTIYRAVKCVATSAILAAPGSQTGEMLLGYPFTGVSTSHSEERMRIQLRLYLGSVLYTPENVLVMPNVFVENVKEQFFFAGGSRTNQDSLQNLLMGKGTSGKQAWYLSQVVPTSEKMLPMQITSDATADDFVVAAPTGAQTEDVLKQIWPKKATALTAAKLANVSDVKDALTKSLPALRIRDGAVFDENGKLKSVNTGEFGILDDPVKYTGLNGAPQPYLDTSTPMPFTV